MSDGVKHRVSPLSQPPQGSGLFLPDHLILEKLGFHLSSRSQALLLREGGTDSMYVPAMLMSDNSLKTVCYPKGLTSSSNHEDLG